MNCTILKNGDLLITASNQERADIAYGLSQERGYWSVMADCFESFSCNGSYTPFNAGDANPFVGLTSAPCIAESMTTEDDGQQRIDGRFWWFPDYAIRDPLDELKNRGRTVFTGTGVVS